MLGALIVNSGRTMPAIDFRLVKADVSVHMHAKLSSTGMPNFKTVSRSV